MMNIFELFSLPGVNFLTQAYTLPWSKMLPHVVEHVAEHVALLFPHILDETRGHNYRIEIENCFLE